MSDTYYAQSGTQGFALQPDTFWADDETQIKGYTLVRVLLPLDAALEDCDFWNGDDEEYIAGEYLNEQWEFTADEVLAAACFVGWKKHLLDADCERVRPVLEKILREREARALRELKWVQHSLRTHGLPPHLPPVQLGQET